VFYPVFPVVLQPGVGLGGHQLSCCHASRERVSEVKDSVRSPCSVNGPMNAYLCEVRIPTLQVKLLNFCATILHAFDNK